MKPVIRPATSADFLEILGEPLPYRVRAFAVEKDGKVLGVGGLAYLPDGTIGAFVHQVPGAGRAHPIAIHRAGLATMKEAKRLGFQRVVAMAAPEIDSAVRWLDRLGFKATTQVEGCTVYVWENNG